MEKSKQGSRNKRKGSNAERLYAQKFRELGFELCQTSRYASKLYDDAKIDLVHIPYNIQIKAGIQNGMNAGKELVLMDACINSMFPKYDPVRTFPKILVHHKQVGYGNKRTEEDSLVYMSFTQFKIFESIVGNNLSFLGLKKGKLESTSEFKDIVWMSFKYFSENIVSKLNQNGD